MFLRKLASLSLALALVYSISLPARAELLKNFKTDGSIEVRSFGIDNETDRNGSADDYRSETHTRIMLGGSFDLLDDVHSRVLLRKNNRVYGGGAENANTVQSNVIVDNAYAKIDKVFGRVDLTMGRQFYGTADDILIYAGPQSDDVLSVTSLDLFRADAELGKWAKLQAISGKVSDTGATGATSNSDTTLWGFEANTDKVIPMGNLTLGYYTRQLKKQATGLNGTDNNTANSLDVKANGDIVAGLGYYGQFVQNFGRNSGTTGNANNGTAYLVGLNAMHDISKMPVRGHVEYGRGSADFASIAAGKRFGKIWGEQTTVGPSTLNGVGGNGLTNLKVVDAGIGTQCPITKILIDLNWYRFMYDRATAAGKSSAGSELDLVLTYKHSENVSFEASAARFFVGDALQNTGVTPTSPITRLGADVKIKF